MILLQTHEALFLLTRLSAAQIHQQISRRGTIVLGITEPEGAIVSYTDVGRTHQLGRRRGRPRRDFVLAGHGAGTDAEEAYRRMQAALYGACLDSAA